MEGVKRVKFVEKTVTDPWWCSWKAPFTFLCIYKHKESPLDVFSLEIIVKIAKIVYYESFDLKNIHIEGYLFKETEWITMCGRFKKDPCTICLRPRKCLRHPVCICCGDVITGSVRFFCCTDCAMGLHLMKKL